MRVSFLCFIVLVVTLYSCNPSPDKAERLKGKWKVAKTNCSEINCPPVLQKELESMIFTFKEDGLLLHSDFYRNGALGTWKLTSNQDSLICEYLYQRAAYTDSYRLQVKENKLILTTSDFEIESEVKLELNKLK